MHEVLGHWAGRLPGLESTIAVDGATLEIRAWRDDACRMFGYGPAEMLDQPFEVLMPRNRWGEVANLTDAGRDGQRRLLSTLRCHRRGHLLAVFEEIMADAGEDPDAGVLLVRHTLRPPPARLALPAEIRAEWPAAWAASF